MGWSLYSVLGGSFLEMGVCGFTLQIRVEVCTINDELGVCGFTVQIRVEVCTINSDLGVQKRDALPGPLRY